MTTFAPSVMDTEKPIFKLFTLNPAQAAGTYDLCTASGGDVQIVSVDVYVATAVVGLTSVSLQSNDTSAVTFMSAAEGALANLTGGKNAKNYSNNSILASTKKIQYTIIGIGSAGSIKVYIQYRRSAAGVDLV